MEREMTRYDGVKYTNAKIVTALIQIQRWWPQDRKPHSVTADDHVNNFKIWYISHSSQREELKKCKNMESKDKINYDGVKKTNVRTIIP